MWRIGLAMRPALSERMWPAVRSARSTAGFDDEHLLLVASDRDLGVRLRPDSTIPDKGRVLTASEFILPSPVDAPNHLAGPPTTRVSPTRCWVARCGASAGDAAGGM